MSRYKPYPKYKPNGVEWLGEVPEHWEVKSIKRDFFIVNGSTPKSTESTYWNGNIIWVTPADLSKRSNIYITDSIRKITEDGLYSCGTTLVPPGSIILSSRAPIGNLAIAKIPLCTNQGCKSIIPTTIKDTRFLYYYLSISSEQLNQLGRGTTFMELSADELGFFQAPFPPKNEQTTIANFLDRETARIDTLIGKQERLIELLQEKIIAVAMDEQINGAGKFERLRHLVDIIERPVMLNPQTEYTALGLYNRGRGLFHKPAKHGNEMGDSDFFYVESGDLILSGQFAWEGAVALAKDTENGCVVSHRYPVLRGKKLHTEYLLALFMTDFGNFLLNECSRGAAGRNRPLNTGLLLSEKIRIPSESTQNIIKKLVHKKFEIEQKANQAIKLLKERRTALISAAVTGKIDVREVE